MSGRWQVVGVVRGVRDTVSEYDPAGFVPRRKRGVREEKSYLDEYVTPSLAAARAILRGATLNEWLEILRSELVRLYPDRKLSRRAFRRIRRAYSQRWSDDEVDTHVDRIMGVHGHALHSTHEMPDR